MECNQNIIIITCTVYVIALIIFIIQLGHLHTNSHLPYTLVTLNFIATASVLGIQISSTCHIVYCTWGSITLAFLFVGFVAETFHHCTKQYK